MTNTSKLSSKAPSSAFLGRFRWETLALLISAFWLSSSVLLDFLFMPMMYGSGMMNEPGFASGSYGLFWMYNRVEVLCAATVLSALLTLRYVKRDQFDVVVSGARSRWAMLIVSALLAITLIYTYVLTPHMSALSLNLSGNIYEPMPVEMSVMHLSYWGLEALKLVGVGMLMKLCYSDVSENAALR